MSFNFFDWIRDGVKNSVLHGVNDAVNAMGMPPEDSSTDKILGYLKNNSDDEIPVRRISAGSASASPKKLGRTLKDMAATS